MDKRLDMGRCGAPVDLWRRVRRKWRGVRALPPVAPPSREACRDLQSRRVQAGRRADPNSAYRRVFSGIEEFPALAVYAHGSWGDGTMTPFSDYDDLIIVDYSCIRDPGEMRRLENALYDVDARFCRLDPLQHHGHWIVAREDLAALDESYIPLKVLDGAVCVQGDLEVGYSVDMIRSAQGFRNNINMTCEGIELLFAAYQQHRINLFDMKSLVGSFFIIPAYVFQSRGQVISKAEAIGRAEELFGAGGCSLISKCSAIRREWGRVVGTPEFGRFRRIGGLCGNGNLHRRYAQRFAPSFPVAAFPRLEAGEVEEFLEKARGYAN